LRIAILCFDRDREILREVEDHLRKRYEVKTVVYDSGIWPLLLNFDCIVAYMPSGIVIRGLCKHLRNKWVDPAVVVLDKPLMHSVPILGGHHGGNEVAMYLEEMGIKAIILTAMEFSDGVAVGVGFRKGSLARDIKHAIENALREVGLKVEDIRVISTIEEKRGGEVVKVADMWKKPLIFVGRQDINEMDIRETKARLIGVKSVSEACAIYASINGELILSKKVYGGVTVAIAR
jgi:cobalt-precorrin 5A hydrolase